MKNSVFNDLYYTLFERKEPVRKLLITINIKAIP